MYDSTLKVTYKNFEINIFFRPTMGSGPAIIVSKDRKFLAELTTHTGVVNEHFYWIKTWSDDRDVFNVKGLVDFLIENNYLTIIAEFRACDIKVIHEALSEVSYGGIVYLVKPNLPTQE